MSIPATLHRIWLDPGDDPMPAVFEQYGRDFVALHPGWLISQWRDPRQLPLLRNQDLFDRAKQIFPRDWKRFQADILRLELLWRYGGIYADADLKPLRRFHRLRAHDCVVPYSPNRGPNGERLLSQYVIGARPGHPFIGACIQQLAASVRAHRGKHLARVAGPWHISRVYASQPWPDVTTLPERTFCSRGVPAALAHEVLAEHQWNSGLRRRGKGLG